MKRKSFIILVFIIVMFSSCQKTPQKEIVVSKNQDTLIKEIKNGAEQDANIVFQNIDTTWKEEAFGLGDTISINANVIIPNISSIAVNIVKPYSISQDKANLLVDYFTEGSVLYNESFELTKSDYEELILLLEANINDPNADWKEATKHNNEEYNEAFEKKNTELNQLKQLYANAPETVELIPADLSFNLETSEGQMGIDDIFSDEIYSIKGCIKKNNGNIARLYIYNSDNGSGVTFTNLQENCYIIQPTLSTFAQTVEYIDELENIDINMDISEASEIAKRVLEDLDIHDMGLFDVGVGKIFAPNETFKDHKRCYILAFTRNYNGILQTYDTESLDYQMAYSEMLPNEKIVMYISDEGLLSFEWIAPVTVIDVLSSNVKLIDFEEIKSKFISQIQIMGVFGEDMTYSKFHKIENKLIKIEKIVLSMEKIKKQDSKDEYIIVPAWNFYGTEVTKYLYTPPNGNPEEFVTKVRLFSHSYLTINAIDGSIIDRALGY